MFKNKFVCVYNKIVCVYYNKLFHYKIKLICTLGLTGIRMLVFLAKMAQRKISPIAVRLRHQSLVIYDKDYCFKIVIGKIIKKYNHQRVCGKISSDYIYRQYRSAITYTVMEYFYMFSMH